MNLRQLSIPNTSDEWRMLHEDHVREMQRRHDEIFRRFPSLDGIVIHSGRAQMKYSRDDQYWPVTSTPHFVHWTPYNSTPALLIIRPGTKPSLYLERHTSYWEGPGPENQNWHAKSFAMDWVDDLRNIALPKSHVWIGDDENHRGPTAWSSAQESDVIAALDGTRTQKTLYEVACIRNATVRALTGHDLLAEIFLAGGGVSELALHHEYLRITQQTDFSVPYGNIVAIGEHAGILHHVHYDTATKVGDLSLLVDAGATCNGYASDITRTYVRGKSPAAEKFAELLRGVDRLQKSLCLKFKVGVDYQDLHNESHELIAGLLKEVRVTTASVEHLVSSGATRCLFPHGLGHSLGIQVHDVGMKLRKSSEQNPYLRNTSVISEGQVVTVEPGLYFIPTLLKKLRGLSIASEFDWNLIELLMQFGGIRIEDNMLATSEGPVNLTRG